MLSEFHPNIEIYQANSKRFEEKCNALINGHFSQLIGTLVFTWLLAGVGFHFSNYWGALALAVGVDEVLRILGARLGIAYGGIDSIFKRFKAHIDKMFPGTPQPARTPSLNAMAVSPGSKIIVGFALACCAVAIGLAATTAWAIPLQHGWLNDYYAWIPYTITVMMSCSALVWFFVEVELPFFKDYFSA